MIAALAGGALAWGALVAWIFLWSVEHGARGALARGGRGAAASRIARALLIAILLFIPAKLGGAAAGASLLGFVVARNVALARLASRSQGAARAR
ncbi:MAG: hypothetical protein IT378_07325 [Sandaracinaceae bacterium]|nr:hypothetical protein [Sandaracinaceae bacterium]